MEGSWRTLVSCNRSLRYNSAPKERRNLAYGVRRCEKFGWRRPLRSARLAIAPENAHLNVCASPLMSDFFTASKPWVEAPSLFPYPSPSCPGEGCPPADGRREGVRTQGSRPGLRYFAASRLSNGTLGAREFINELRLQDTSRAGAIQHS
jgi:hypothetical protein